MLQHRIIRYSHQRAESNTKSIRLTGSPQTKLLVSARKPLRDEVEGIYVDRSSQQTLPEDDDEDNVDGGDEIVDGYEREEEGIYDLNEWKEDRYDR